MTRRQPIDGLRILVTGSRDWRDRTSVEQALDLAVAQVAGTFGRVVLVHGACPTGADAMAETWALAHGVKVDAFPADWAKWGKRAGFRRNVDMVRSKPDICLAFSRVCRSGRCEIIEAHGSHGTAHCMRVARDAQVPTSLWRDGW